MLPSIFFVRISLPLYKKSFSFSLLDRMNLKSFQIRFVLFGSFLRYLVWRFLRDIVVEQRIRLVFEQFLLLSTFIPLFSRLPHFSEDLFNTFLNISSSSDIFWFFENINDPTFFLSKLLLKSIKVLQSDIKKIFFKWNNIFLVFGGWALPDFTDGTQLSFFKSLFLVRIVGFGVGPPEQPLKNVSVGVLWVLHNVRHITSSILQMTTESAPRILRDSLRI